MASSPFRPGSTLEDQLSYYKAQYEQLEGELQDFQASSRELEAELEKDVEASEKRERKLKEQVETLGYEVDEWKTKCKQSKDEANRAQTSLQKEVTTMRETNRGLQLKLRDIEVANDDYETQARHTTSSLEDLESKYNVSIERGVMLEEEIRSGEQEREQLRIETQRLRDELSDLRVESEITLDKLRHAEASIERLHSRKQPMHSNPARPLSVASQISTITPPSPSISTPPPMKSDASGSEAPTPPSPPLSDVPGHGRAAPKVAAAAKGRSLFSDNASGARQSMLGNRMPRHSRGPSLGGSGFALTSSQRMAPPPSRPANNAPPESLARSGSLYQIKGLIGRMQKIEERVHSVRQKLPPSSRTTPRNSPRAGSAADSSAGISGSVTVRSNRRKTSASTALSAHNDDAEDAGRLSDSHVKRLSFGVQPPSVVDRPSSSASRPSSRANNPADNPFVRPSSRLSISGARTPLGHYASSHSTTVDRRPRSSMSGNYAKPQSRHGHSASITEIGSPDVTPSTPTTARRTTIDRRGVPTPSTASRRQSGSVNGATLGRRPSLGFDILHKHNDISMPPPSERARKLSGVGETF